TTTPYNTYRINGLTPTPIANPSLASLLATVQPEQTPYLYFVANGEGGHTFSQTLQQHNAAVRHYRSLKR
ncbi:MAG: endolytic transglycosylase MltG, partial [Ferrimonas sp.]